VKRSISEAAGWLSALSPVVPAFKAGKVRLNYHL
jgi:hypothetical protein